MDLTTKQILILGGGFGGVRAALDLEKKNLTNAKITLVSRDQFHEYHPDLYEVAASFLPEDGDKRQKRLRYEHLRGTVAVPLNKIFQNKDVDLIYESVVAIDLKSKIVSLKDGKKLDFDYLVIALGSVTNFFGNQKLEETSLPLKTVSDALNIRDNIDELFLEKKRNQEIRIVVGGGGFTGCELAGELVNYLKSLAKLHNHPLDKLEISIVEASPNLINGADQWFQSEALKRLTKLGVKTHLNSKIVDVEDHRIIFETGEKVNFDILVWTAGIKANSLTEKISNVKLEKNVCLAIDRYSRTIGYENVFAIGDNCFCFDTEHNHPVPPTAQLAISQGRSVAVNIAHLIKKEEMEVYEPQMPNFVIPMGKGFALAKVFGFKVKGLFAWWLKRFVALGYISSIVTPLEALKVWWGGITFFIED